MVSIRRRLNTWESVKSVGLDLLVEAKNQKKLNDCRRMVQPLLNALRFVESSNHLHCPDGDNGLSIGPLQISELYHLDAWKHQKAYAWILCRDLEHAENTVIAYWLKYCPDALVKGDWETLAKVHNGGPQGCAMAKTVCYWSKVSSHLQQHEPSEVICTNAKVGALQCLEKLSVVKNSSKTDVIKKLSQLDRKRVLAVIKSDKPVILGTANRGSTLHHKRKLQRSARIRLHRVAGSRQISSRSSDSKQLSPFIVHRVKSRQLTTDVSSKHTSLQSMLHFGYWTFPQSAKQHQAAILLQAFWRMHVARLWYQRVQRVVLLIQKWWRQCLSQKAQGAIMILANSGIEKDQEILDEHHAQTDAHQRIYPSLDAMTGDPSRLPEEPGDTGGCLLEMPRSPVDSLYDINISEKRKDEILTELATSFFLAPEGDRFSRNPTGDKSMELFHTTDIDNVADMANINSAFSLALSADALSFSFPQLPDEKLKDKGPTVLSSPLQVWNQTVLETGTIPPIIDGREPTSVDLCGSPTETVKIFPSVALKGNHLEEWPLSPTREWISVAAGSCKLSPSWKIRVPIKGKCDDNLPQSGRRCQDLGQVDIPSSRWNSKEVKSMSAHGGCIQAPSHNAKKSLGAAGSLECFPVSAGLLAGESERCFGLIPQIDDVSASSDIGVGLMTPPCNRTPLVGHTCEVESPLSPAMEEELLEELAKLLHTGANALSSSGTTNLQASAPRLTGTLDSCLVSQATVQIKGNSRKPARKLYFHVGKEDKLQEITANGLPQYTAGDKLIASSVGPHTTCAQESDSNKMLEDNTRCNVTQTSLAVSQPSIVALQSECELLQKNKLLETAAGMYELKGSLQPVRDGHQNTAELKDRFQNHSDGISESLSPLPEACSSKNPWGPNNPWSHSYHRPTSHTEIKAVYGEVPVKTTEQHDGSSVLVADVRPGTSLVPSLSRWQETPNIQSECSQSILADSMVTAPSDQFYARIDSQPDCNSHKHGEEQPQISSHRQLSSAKTASDVDQTSRSNEDMPLSCSAIDIESLPGNGCPYPSSPDSQCSVKISKGTTFRAMYEQEISSAQSMSISRKYFLQSQVIPSPDFSIGCDSDSESTVSTANFRSATDDLLESLEKRTPTSYQQALFTCEDSSLCKLQKSDLGESLDCVRKGEPWVENTFDSLEKQSKLQKSDVGDSPDCVPKGEPWVENTFDKLEKQSSKQCLTLDNFSGPLPITPRSQAEATLRRSASSSCTWACGLRGTAGHCLPSLDGLCKLWDEQCVDLLTRALKYKQLVADPNLLTHEVRLAYDVPPLHGPPTIAWEIQSIERLLERLENREMLKELVKQQRDIIYTNIATHASRRERYQMYNKWGIRKLSTGRLRKIVYGMLWKDAKRYNESADLVMQYL